MAIRLFHFSDDPTIERFEPRVSQALRPPGREWLNEPLVWAIEESHQHMYLFPRDCPRILVWPVAGTSPDDHQRWFGRSSARVIAHIEWAWLERVRSGALYRYEFAPDGFESLDDAGMWVSRGPVVPRERVELRDLLGELATAGVELRLMDSLAPLAGLWDETTMHVSGIRLRNAKGWHG